MENGLYWVICKEVDDEPQIAALVDDEWYMAEFAKAFTHSQVTIVSKKH